MAAPNVVNVLTITGKTDVQADIGLTPTAIVTNAAASDDLYKVNTLVISNSNDSDLTVTATVDLFRSSTPYLLASNISLVAGASLDVLSSAVYLEEGDSLRITCNDSDSLDAIASYEIITD